MQDQLEKKLVGQVKPEAPRRVRKTRDAARTQKRILDAAESFFAKHGFEGASTESIARKAGVSKTMLFYYFTSKEKLYVAVLKRAFEAVIDKERAEQIEKMPPPEALRALVDDYIDIHIKRPTYAELTIREVMIYGGKYLQQLKFDLPFIGQMIRTIGRGTIAGVFRDVDPLKTTVSILGLTKVLFTYHDAIERMLDRDILAPEEIQKWHEHISDLLLRGIQLCPQEDEAPQGA